MDCAFKIGVRELGAREVGVPEVGAPEVGAVEGGAREVGVPEVGVPEVGAVEGGAREVGVLEVGVLEVGAPEVGVLEVGAAEFSAMAKRPYLVNTARAAALDYDALLAALANGRIAGALLDVYPDEPLAPGSPLRAVDRARLHLTPHAAGVSGDVPANTARLLADGLARLLQGQRPDHVVNPQTLEVCFRRLGATL